MASPLFFGDYPPVMREFVDAASEEEELESSRLPTFTREWSEKIKGSLDFLGLNHYSTELVKPAKNPQPDWWGDRDVRTFGNDSWDETVSGRHVVPWGFRRMVNWIKDRYGNPDLYITENGYSDPEDGVGTEDTERVDFHRQYMNELLKAVLLDGCNVKSYTAWSLLDNMEWTRGYT